MLNQEVYAILNNPGNAIVIPGLDRIQQVLLKLGDPQHQYKVIHITGSNGKGSTAEFIATGLIHTGYKVGKYTSPYIKVINETITLNHQQISSAELEEQFYIIKEILTQYNLTLSPFEYLTVIMFNYFATHKIDYLVLEVGMGGTDDATNVVDPIISIITNISLEHTKFLGNTLTDIARAKCGIIKCGTVIIADNKLELIKCVEAKTTAYTNILKKYKSDIKLDYDNFKTRLKFVKNSLEPNTSVQSNYYDLSLFGHFQANNFLCAYEVFKQLDINETSIKYAAENTKHRGRFEVIDTKPLVVLDASHNLAGAVELVYSLQGQYNPDDVMLVVAVLQDKDQDNMLREFAKISHHIICTSIPNNPRAMEAKELQVLAKRHIVDTAAISDPQEALSLAKSLDVSIIIVTGSIYLLTTFIS